MKVLKWLAQVSSFIFTCLKDNLFFTGPPSAPSRTNLVGSTGESAFISWDPPSLLGGRDDLFYNILLDNGTHLVLKNTEPIYANNYTITGLRPVTFYIAFVLSENGVSFHEENALGRGAQISFKTAPGSEWRFSSETYYCIYF